MLVVNEVLNGAARTLFDGSVQPSELAKIVIVIYLSVWLYSKRAQLQQISFGLVPLAVILGMLGGLILIQPDLSATVTIIILGGLMFFLAGGDLRQIFILMIVTLIVGLVVVQVSPTGSERIADYLAGLKDPTESSYHVRRAYEAFVKGGWLGVGLGRAETKLTGLPVPPTDSIFAVVGEETGVFGAVALVGLYLVFLWRGLTISRRAPDQMGALLAAGLTLVDRLGSLCEHGGHGQPVAFRRQCPASHQRRGLEYVGYDGGDRDIDEYFPAIREAKRG